MRTFVIGWIAALGLCVGSFLTVVTSRVPLGGSILSPPSACTGCGGRIRWYDNIPVVSWAALRGRCRSCQKAIPMRYPALELGVGMMFALVALVVRPLLVPVFLAATSGGIATATAWLIHGSFDRKIAATSTAFVAVIAVATAGVGAVASI